MGKFAMGQSVPRTEDPRLLTGRGRYIDDVSMIGQCHAFVLRSPHAHARIRSIDVAAAKDYVRTQGTPIVIKADGLAAGKGVIPQHGFEHAAFAR